MILILVFAFLAGIVTILSPCILPILPIILSSSVDQSGRRRPIGVVVGFVTSFTFFTLFLSTIVRTLGIPAQSPRLFSIVILVVLGFSLLVPKIQLIIEQLFSKLVRFLPNNHTRQGFVGGVTIGFSLGLLWTPCVGPILASVITLALSGTVTLQALFITLAYSIGTAIPMLLIMLAGSTALRRVPWLVRNTASIQKAFGVLMILTAIGILFNFDRRFQSFILDKFPNYGVGLTKFEDNALVKDGLDSLNQSSGDVEIGKPMSDITQPAGPLAPEIISGGKWFNSSGLKLADLRGKVVLLDFWTYTCINCQRTLPYIQNWWMKYKDKGLVVIGIHSPEFEFEKDENNVARAISDFGLTYPVVQDNNFSTWRAYFNRYWPAKYFIDKDGVIRDTHFGEGDYDKSEKIIQDLLKEINGETPATQIINPECRVYSKTQETYLGYARISNFASLQPIKKDAVFNYSFPSKMIDNSVAFEGEWIVLQEYANPRKGAKLQFNFESKEVFLVMRSTNGSSKIKVYVDGQVQAPGADAKAGEVVVNTDRLYKLVKLTSPGSHILRLEFVDDNAQLYAFTFG